MYITKRNSRSRSTIRSRLGQRRQRLDDHLYRCVLCENFHSLRFCKRFLRMTAKKREDIVERHRYCVNCLAKSHDLRGCTSMDTCKKCDRFHHTLLHQNPNKPRKPRSPKKREEKSTHKKSTQQKPSTTSKLSTTPDAKILVEAIRSLAHVLCANTENSVD